MSYVKYLISQQNASNIIYLYFNISNRFFTQLCADNNYFIFISINGRKRWKI